jgi:hypothetical protein
MNHSSKKVMFRIGGKGGFVVIKTRKKYLKAKNKYYDTGNYAGYDASRRND